MTQKLTVSGMGDMTNYLLYGSLTVKLNTCDFTLIDPPLSSPSVLPAIGATVTVKDPTWIGTVVSYRLQDVVDITSGHLYVIFTATNTAVATPGQPLAPFNLSAAPSAAAPVHWETEAGQPWELEDNSAWAPDFWDLESSTDSYGYRELSATFQQNVDGSDTFLIEATIFQPGLWPGMILNVISGNLFSTNLVPNTEPAQVTQVITMWQGLAQPVFRVQMTQQGTPAYLPTLNNWRILGR